MLLHRPEIAALMNDKLRKLNSDCREFFDQKNFQHWLDPNTNLIRREFWSEAGKRGLLGLSVAKKYGGHDMNLLSDLIIKDVLSKLEDNGLSYGFHVHNNIGCTWLESSFNETLKEKYLPKAVNGESIFCTCYTEANNLEPSVGIDDGENIIINAKKSFVVNGLNADLYLLTLIYRNEPTTVLVEKNIPGISIIKLHDRLGNRWIDQADISFKNVIIPKQNILSKGNIQRLILWNKVMTYARFFVAVDAYYLLERLYELFKDYAATRIVAGQVLDKWPIQQQLLSRQKINLHVLTNALCELFLQINSGTIRVFEAAKLKYYAVEKLLLFADMCCAANGGYGYMYDGLFTNIYLQALGYRFSSGSQITLLEIVNNQLNMVHKLRLK